MAFMLITAHGTTEVTSRAKELGFGAVLLKPFTADELRTAVESALSSKS
jgi:AmiR/NasT family two-component response regulator